MALRLLITDADVRRNAQDFNMTLRRAFALSGMINFSERFLLRRRAWPEENHLILNKDNHTFHHFDMKTPRGVHRYFIGPKDILAMDWELIDVVGGRNGKIKRERNHTGPTE